MVSNFEQKFVFYLKDSIGNTTVQRVKFERNRINTTSEEWNLKSKFHEAEGRVKFGFQISLFTSGIYEVEFKFHELYGGISYEHHDSLF